MSDSLIYGICDSCEKKYRVPSADKTYPCKACGGTVAVHELREERTASERFNARRGKDRGSVGIWVGTALLVLAVGGGLLGYQIGWFGTVHGAEADARLFETSMDQVNQALQEKWAAGDAAGLEAMHHPTGREEFRQRLDSFGSTRGWTTWPALNQSQGTLEGGTPAAPEKGLTLASFGDNYLRVRWQWDGNNQRWYIYNFWVSPTALAPRVESFRQAWDSSNLEALKPFFKLATADKMEELFKKRLEKAGWTDQHPKLGKVAITGAEEVKNPASETLGVKVESVFETGGEQAPIVWRFDQRTDQWMVSGVGF